MLPNVIDSIRLQIGTISVAMDITSIIDAFRVAIGALFLS